MDSRYSPINDMYGVTPRGKPPKRISSMWPFVLGALAGLFIYESIHPVMRLRPDPPRSVMGAKLNSTGAEHQAQEPTARACWDFAIQSLQKTYRYGRVLPVNPPRIPGNSNGSTPAINTLCWQRLRLAWPRSESWVQTYEWKTDWITKTIHNLVDF